ncbi:hypothetical protein ABE85_01970 [Mitsuaria sp. 7]|nr:hypothetical protein ABE85_01970 [Mitsuaria sp. 7]
MEATALTVAAVVVLAAIAASVFCAYIKENWVAGIFASTTIGALAWAFNSAKSWPDRKDSDK